MELNKYKAFRQCFFQFDLINFVLQGIAAEKKEAKQEKDEAEKYEKLQKDFQNSKTNIMLFKLFYNEREIEEIRNEQFVSLKTYFSIYYKNT